MDERQLFFSGFAADACARAEDLIRQNKVLEALDAFDRALDAQENYEPAIRGIMTIAERLNISQHSSQLERLLRRCMLSPLGNPEALAAPVGRLLQIKYGLPSLSAWSADPTVTENGVQRLCYDILLMAYLSSTVNQNLALERFLTLVREYLVRRFREGNVSSGWQNLGAALAAQAHNNEYIWPDAEEEAGWLDAAGAQIDAAAWEPPGDRSVGLFLIYAMFRDPYDLPGMQKRAQKAGFDGCAAAFRSLFERTVVEPARRAALEHSVRRLTVIDDATSNRVRKMYEDYPYPRWLHLAIPTARFDADVVLKSRFPHLGDLPARDGAMQILMPGVGTGRHALWAASRYENVEITAVDLSLRSLAYGQRMAERYGIENVTFMQGDILSLEGQYDRIECTGVLHHLKDPEAGFQRLAACLKPGGVMQVMVYADGNRQDIYRLRSRLDGFDQMATTDEVRQIRGRIVRGDGDLAEFVGLARRPDFHSASGFRDLILHVQESAFTVARVREMVESTQLKFVGFEFTTGRVMQMFAESEAERRYREAYPGELTLSNLANWERLEQDHENLMSNYYFWCQRPRQH